MEYPLTYNAKNIVIGSTLSAEGDIIIGDVTYHVGDHFDHSILFLRIERGDKGYSADLSLKTRHSHLRQKAEGMLHERVVMQIPEYLFKQVNDFQASRRSMSENMRRDSVYANPSAFEDQISQLIYDHFFAGDIGFVIRNFLHALGKHKISELLLVVSSPDERIRNLPWEMVLDRLGAEGHNALQMQGFGLVRTWEADITGFNMEGIPIRPAPLKMLFITALPENLSERGKKLELEDEQKKLIDAVGALEATGDSKPRMVIEFLDVASLREIKKALQERDHDVLHISGHGGWLEDLRQGILYLENDGGDRSDTKAQEFAETLHGLKHLKLVVLSACETAVAGDAGTADVLAASGVPAVLAMRFSVTDEGAKVFTTAFYQKLVQGNSITEAMAYAREKLLEKVLEQRKQAQNSENSAPAEWFTPVLYLNQYMEKLVDAGTYLFPAAFYPHSSFLKEAHTRLIGGGFIGRKRQRIAMRRAFREGRHVCLVGLGGMGKTTLAEAFAQNYENRNHKTLIWRGDKEITELGILNRIVEEYRNWQPNSPLLVRLKSVIENAELPILNRVDYLINNCLAGEKTILIFDNFEDLQWQEGDASQRMIVDDGVREMLNHLLVHAPDGCHVIFTTRYRIEGLPGDVCFLNLNKLSIAEQYRLMNFSPVLRGIAAEDREKIYTRLDGLPRAYGFLEGLVRHDPGFSWDALEAALGKMEADVFADLLLGRIYGLLSPVLQRVFLVASVFFTRTPVEALVVVCGDAEVAVDLEGLMGWSLCYYDAVVGEFEVHGLVREWVGFQGLLVEEVRKQVANDIANYFLKGETLYRISVATKYFSIAKNWVDFVKHSEILQFELRRRGFYSVARSICEEAIHFNISLEINAKFRNYLGNQFMEIGEFENSLHWYNQAFEDAKSNGDSQFSITILGNLAWVSAKLGDPKTAIEMYKTVLAQSTDDETIAASNSCIGVLYYETDDFAMALKHLNLGYDKAVIMKDPLGQSTCLVNRARMFTKLGKYTDAIKDLEAGIKLKKELVDEDGLASAYHGMGVVLYNQGKLEASIPWFSAAYKKFQKIGTLGYKSSEGYLLEIVPIIGEDRFQEILQTKAHENL